MNSTYRTAAKAHECPMCMGEIPKGERYLEMVALPGQDPADFFPPHAFDRPATTRVHLRCWYAGPRGDEIIARIEAS